MNRSFTTMVNRSPHCIAVKNYARGIFCVKITEDMCSKEILHRLREVEGIRNRTRSSNIPTLPSILAAYNVPFGPITKEESKYKDISQKAEKQWTEF